MRALLSGIGLLIVAVTAVVASSQEPHSSYSETISVVRYIVDVRVAETAGNAIRDLSAGDFVVTVAGKAAVVESATWIGENERAPAPPDRVNLPEAAASGATLGSPIGRPMGDPNFQFRSLRKRPL